MIKFGNFEFMFGINGPKLGRRGEEIQNKHGTN